MAYGIAEGLDEADVRRIANPKVIKLLRKAMLYDKGEKVVTKKVNQTPTRVKKTGGREALETVPSNRLQNLEKTLQSGRATDDDAIALLTWLWGAKSRSRAQTHPPFGQPRNTHRHTLANFQPYDTLGDNAAVSN